MDMIANLFSISFIISIAKYPAVFAIAFVSTYLLTPVIRKWAINLNIVDKPSPGRINTRVIPRAGGIAVFLGFHISLVVALLLVAGLEISSKVDIGWWISFALGSVVILCIGLYDDIMDMPAIVKLMGQIGVAVLMYTTGLKFTGVLGLEIPAYLELICTVVWFLAIINAFNLIDGVDGLATGLASIGAAGIAGALIFLHHPGDALVLFGFVGACLAFLRYNFHPATIFLGDSGSMFLGFTLAAVGLAVNTKGATIAALGVPLLAVGVPMFDTVLAVWRRSVRRMLTGLLRNRVTTCPDESSGVMTRDLDHLHHRLLREGLNQKAVAVSLYTASAILVVAGLSSMVFASASAGIFLICFVVGTYVIVGHVARIELWDSGKVIVRGIQMPSAKVFFRLAAPASDSVCLGLMLFFSLYLTMPTKDISGLKHVWRDWFPVLAGVPLSILALSGSYSIIWSRSRISEFFSFAARVIGGGIVAWALLIFAGFSTLSQSDTISVFVYLVFALCFMLGSRAVPLLIGDLMMLADKVSHKDNRKVRKILLYGAGDSAVLFLHHYNINSQLNTLSDITDEQVVGFVDSDSYLKNRTVHGYHVFGGLEQLEQVANEIGVDEVVVTDKVTPEEEFHLLKTSKLCGFQLTRWVTRREPLRPAAALGNVSSVDSPIPLIRKPQLASNE